MATAAPRRFCRCACFCSQNLYVARYRLHLRFRDEQQLRRDYGPLLRSRGCVSSKDFQQLLEELEQEVGRRRRLGQESAARRALIASSYHPARPDIYRSLQDEALAPEFVAAAEYSASPGAGLGGLLQRLETVSEEKRIYRVPVFSVEFCQALLEELEHFEQSDMPKGRPNTMNNYGSVAGASLTATVPLWSSMRWARTWSWAATMIMLSSPSMWPWARPSQGVPYTLGASSR
ncbi:2-oxoglutarate and iron-dependent oxygenase domain-containing protein 2 isoform X3 [Mesocricetus auratus]|uniref:2-oxoglutarate and iron-dependent oxygenase domain-containing protein 2 isoform X3 n=1 Tax=Mesocricetus auratus TaxID=10036 RepID=A0A3Q0D8H7_MESAU|nr:2-oxoglutarate and iron-dependent oxygenase domain-containing protein 2 isoform X3 [Mesocricetus auratus]